MTIREQIREIIEPRNESIYSRLYDWTMLSAIVIGILPLMFRGHHKVFFYFDLFSGLCFIIDYLLRWITADVPYKHNRALAFLIYPFTPMAIIDLLSILPTFNMLSPTFKVARILWTVFSLAIFYIFITALIMFNAEEDINPETGQYLFTTFFDAFYWAACTLTTVGYGDLYPISNIGRVISIISSMVGIAIIALPSGIVTAGYIDELKSRKDKDSESK